MIDKKSRIYITGHTGLIGSTILRKYKNEGYVNLLTKTHQDVNLIDQKQVNKLFEKEKPEYVIMAAARVGGIKANMTYPADFMYENLMIQNNVIWAALQHNVKKLLYISCGCAYPTQSKQPMKEEYILTGVPEPTNEGFAIAKIAGIKLCEKIYQQHSKKFISCIPANTYGENDHFEEEKSHVIPALIKRFHQAKENSAPDVTLWGTGKARREFIYVDDLAHAISFLMKNYDEKDYINIGSGEDVTIAQLAEIIKDIVGYKGKIVYNTTKPDGMTQRILDASKIKNMGFICQTSLKAGIKITYDYFLKKI